VADVKPPILLPATIVRPYAAATDTLAVLILLEGHFLFIGNRDYEPDPDSQYDGIHPFLPAIPGVFRAIAPPGSLGGIVRYDKGATVLAPLGPLDQLDGGRFGTEADYAGLVTRDLVTGVETSVELLSQVTTVRKALVIITDGADTNIDQARIDLARLKRRCDQDRIEVYAVGYVANIGDELTAIKALVPDILIAQSADAVPARITDIAHRIGARTEIEFASAAFPWDGKQHDVQVLLDGAPWPPHADALELGFAVLTTPKPARGSSLTWLIALGLVIAAAVTYALVRFLPNR
jgi:hypothetical protein